DLSSPYNSITNTRASTCTVKVYVCIDHLYAFFTPPLDGTCVPFFFFFKQKTAYEIGLGIPAEPLFRSHKVHRMEMKTAISCTILRHTKILIAVGVRIISLATLGSKNHTTNITKIVTQSIGIIIKRL